ncbi:DUF262 domain-containing protein [Sphingobacterium corticibacterium]|uniref:DUF262 domain-containing protein n=1 Tax=Sphingobacterium corticibacterium TaxID=2484746 RepID=A0A4Q6XFE2_9SPHI|nr:DUF262 domain-containing protein [Sphingobacterium corticibacterium]RZF58571.1 DUF262 domain-containing protein [Sphingobacterium corticibacterium]
MNYINPQEQFIEIFKSNHLKKDARTVSISTLLSDRYLKRINYDPYYQRNYVWEKDKQSFFIESVILGTEIPPLVFFKSGMEVEVIDGRQRFETLKRFKENDFSLNLSGLLELQALSKKTYSKLSPEIQQLFLNTKIRIFEFEIVGLPDLDSNMEDRIKKEIFRRYNSGITPLNQSEVDNAKYDADTFSDYFKHKLRQNEELFDALKGKFLKDRNKVKNELIVDMVTFLRKMLILHQFPISRYADSGKNLIIDLLYDSYMDSLNNSDNFKESLENEAETLISQIKSIAATFSFSNTYIFECVLWALRVLESNDIKFDLKSHKHVIEMHYKEKNSIYNTDNDHYYGNVVSRFTDTAELFNKIMNFDFEPYIRSSIFKDTLSKLKQTEADAELTLEKLASLRINKPSPASKPIDQIISDLNENFYLLRPSYQRQEKISVRKASSIIESILLGIKLPPLFIFERNDGIREVIDGQQRLLSILAFMGRHYKNEEGEKAFSINHNFKLKDLRILKHLNGKRFSDVMSEVESKILDFDIDEIEISQDLNGKFEATDLFIRINSKPYPIKPNSFEMWNSTVDKEVIQKIKEVTSQHVNWFYIKAPDSQEKDNRNDRMQNEELITILSYLNYNLLKGIDIIKILGFYHRLEKFTCRIKTKSNLTELLESFEFKPSDKEFFLMSIEQTNSTILNIGRILLDNEPTKESFNSILNIKNLQRFSRSNQEFYILWIILSGIHSKEMEKNKTDILRDIKSALSLLKNVSDSKVDQKYVSDFITSINEITLKYKPATQQHLGLQN